MAVKAPKVETLAKSMSALEPAYSEQRGLINEQMEGLGAASEVRRERLEGAKVNNFNAINEAATGKGMAFSGIPIHEQADYLSDVFLPGMQDIEAIESSERMQLRGTLADLNMQQRTTALSRVDQQQQALNQWNLSQAQIEASRRENELNRRFTTSERIASQKFTAEQNAANRAAPGGGGGSSSSATAQLYSLLQARTGAAQGAGNKDGYVSPATFKQMRDLATSDAYGMSASDFNKQFKSFANPRDISGGYGAYGL